MIRTKRGVPDAEFQSRALKARMLMQTAGLSALLLTTEPEIQYYTGFLTRFWESPTRPWFVVLPVQGDPVAVVPSIGAHLMRQTWITDIRTWDSPDYDDDGIGLLSETLRSLVSEGDRIGVADRMESHLRMPLRDFEALKTMIGRRQITGDEAITRRLRLIKSEAEIDKIRTAASIADRAFDRVSEIARPGVPLADVFRRFQILCLEEGADWVGYLAGASGTGGYADVISPATDTPLKISDVLMLDTGVVWDGYFCDFDRNYCINAPSPDLRQAHAVLFDAMSAAFEIAKPGARICDLYHAMSAVLADRTVPGRLGHGLGMQLTEWPSIIPDDHTTLEKGMVLTLEPVIAMPNGKILVHEENIVIGERGAEFLSTPQSPEIRSL